MSELLSNFTGIEAKKDTGLANILIQSASSNFSFSGSDFVTHRSTAPACAPLAVHGFIYLLISLVTAGATSMEIKNSFLKRIISYFIRGLVLVAPLYATVLIIWSGVEYLDNILPIDIPISNQQTVYLPGLGVLIIILGIILLGFLFSTIVPQSFFKFTESIMRRIPLVSLIYYSIKDLILAFVGDKKKFNQPVLVTMYRETNIKKIGFITQTDLGHLKITDHVAVYMPLSYALSGELFIVPTEQVTLLDAKSTDVMKMLVSGGVSVKVPKEEASDEE